jgi:hypothetical protein
LYFPVRQQTEADEFLFTFLVHLAHRSRSMPTHGRLGRLSSRWTASDSGALFQAADWRLARAQVSTGLCESCPNRTWWVINSEGYRAVMARIGAIRFWTVPCSGG